MPLDHAGDGARVCAVVVTFNRKLLLRQCIHSLHAQSRPIDQIVIVDNCSTDGTPDLLAAEFPHIPVLLQRENLGGSAGFAAGMKWAVESGFDWVWVMDDDVTMRADGLASMLHYAPIADMIQPRKLVNGVPLVWEAIWDARACVAVTYTRDASFDNGRDWTTISYACFEGVLIRCSLIKRAGLPDERYFIAGDDTIYGFVASQHGHVIYVRDIVVEKTTANIAPRGRLFYYLAIRNRFLTYDIFERSGVPMHRRIFLFHQLYATLQLCAQVLRDTQLRTRDNFLAPLEGLLHGMKGRYGKPYWIR